MASNRHLGRIIALQALYEYEFRTLARDPSVDIDLITSKDVEIYSEILGDTEFVYSLVHGVIDHLKDLDDALRPMAPEWPLETIAGVDRNILRIGLYELTVKKDEVPPRVAINEAVELAKAFGSENSSKFINGVLGAAYRNLYPNKESKDENSEQTGQTESSGSSTN
ncbi:transcription antitermination factor NusB [Candidatus Saccharibacteria bacterium]|nr:transcription antitermination factor NusB [Candidatus Saccharibacteria bacterium]MBR0061447.1 transcription antitermination factor NusB [Selenomonadaceae bacterium]